MTGRTVSFRRRAPAFTATALFATLLLGTAAPALAQRNFYIDYEGGNDGADGTTPATAWKHAPGDGAATGTARSMKLAGGDRLLFRGGVRYRGTIRVKFSGEAGKPIVYDGSGWGDRRAIMDGSELLAAPQSCASQAACLGSPHWKNLRFVKVDADAQWSDWLFDSDQPLQLSQWPAINDYWDYDDPNQMAPIPLATLSQLQSGFIAVPGVPARLRQGSPTLGLWHNSNDIFVSTNFEIGTAGVQFVQPNYRPYTNRDNRFSIMNAPSEVDAPGKFAISGKDGLAVFWPREDQVSSRISIGTRRGGFLFGGVSHIRIRGFSFANFASESHENKPNSQSGVPIMGTSTINHVEIHDNQFRAVVNHTKMGAVRFARGQNLDVRRNYFDFLPWSTAIYVSEGQGPAVIACNRILRIGRNGVRVLNNFETLVEGNRIESLYGIHGTGINLYLDNRLATVRDNVVTASRQPMTVHGDNNRPYFADSTPPFWLIQNNILVSTDPQAAALSSWGKNLRNVRIEGNFLSNPRYAIRLSGGEQNVALVNNHIVGQIAHAKGEEFAVETGNRSYAVEGNGVAMVSSVSRQTSRTRC